MTVCNPRSRSSVAVRGFLVQMIYRKALRIESAVAMEIGTAQSTSLMSVDIERMVDQMEAFHLVYSSIIIITIGFVILYYTIGVAFVATIIVAVMFIACIPFVAKRIPFHQKAWSARTDCRVKLINSVLRNIKAVKLSGYESILISKLEELRRIETNKQGAYLWRVLVVSACRSRLGTLDRPSISDRVLTSNSLLS